MVAGRLKPSRGDSEKCEKHKLSRRSALKTGVEKEEDNHEKRSSYVLRLNQRGLNIVFRIGAAQELLSRRKTRREKNMKFKIRSLSTFALATGLLLSTL